MPLIYSLQLAGWLAGVETSKQTGSNLNLTNFDETRSDRRSSRGRNRSRLVSSQPNLRLRTTRSTLPSSSVRNRVSVDRQTTSSDSRSSIERHRSRLRLDQRSSSSSSDQSGLVDHSSISDLSDINQRAEDRNDLPEENIANEGEEAQQNEEAVNRRVRQYFDAIGDERDKWRCNVEECGHELRGHVFHMKRHLQRMYQNITQRIGFQLHLPQREPRQQAPADNNDNGQLLPKRQKLDLDLNKTVKSLIRLFISRNYAFAGADDWLKELHILKQKFDAYGKTFNRHILKRHIMQESQQIYHLISEDLRGLRPSIMFDSASRNDRHIFSASLRYAQGTEIIERTIGMLTQHDQQTGRNLKDQLTKILEIVGLTENDIYATCTDQGANMLRAADLVIEAQEVLNVCRELKRDENADSEDKDQARDEVEMLQQERDDDDIEDDEMHQNLREDDDILNLIQGPLVCGPHTLQLAAKDVTKDYTVEIDQVRAVVIRSKKMVYKQVLVNNRVNKLRSDVKSRWESTYLMLSDVLRNRQGLETVAETYPVLVISDECWDFIDEYVQAFEPVHQAMLEFQRADITMSDFYLRSARMQAKIGTLENGPKNLVTKLHDSVKLRARKFFECDAFVAALLLDKRFTWSANHEVLNANLREKGIQHLEKIHQALNLPVANQQQPEVLIREEEEAANAAELEFQRLIGGVGDRRLRADGRQDRLNIRQQVERFLTERDAWPQDKSILEYWHAKRDNEELQDLYKISQVVYGAAFSQVKVERDFSGLALVLTHLRSLFADNTLNAILVVKNNLDLLDKVKFY
ncbi:hypothetical protein PVAND_015032 [Polypedilum vanderplanki]|uniref:HAT C-terminal dimerisation domain-containing protein n=1 Tax=Polypedilum vanderplanki TaxID=319348 RepID=A0A9J6BBH4_POLVA|nr:hypothetical protein PVAND_015032 [Polypedilum vanderplanki]